jgi:hypothetical protein
MLKVVVNIYHMFDIKDFKTFNEALLNLNQLAAIRDGRIRGNVLIDKLKSSDFFDVEDKNLVVFQMLDSEDNWVDVETAISIFTDLNGNYDIDKALTYFKSKNRFRKVFKTEDGQTFGLNQIKKTGDFGSKGAGVKIREFETVQCIFLGIKQAYPNINLNDRNMVSFYKKYMELVRQTGQSLVKTSDKIDLNLELLDEFYSDLSWLYTFYKIPNRIWRQDYVDKNQLYYIYHVGNKELDSPYVNLNKRFNLFSKQEGFKDINFTKWCPADVYLVAINNIHEINEKIRSCETISEMTNLVDELFDQKILIPISLKKLSEGTDFKVIINREVDKDLPDFKISTFRIGDELKGIGSKIDTFSEWKYRNNKDVDTKKRTLNLDSSDTSKKVDIDGEVEGSSSRHGKISFKALKRIIETVQFENIQKIQSSEELRSLNIEELKDLVNQLIQSGKSIIKSELISVTSISRGSDISTSENKLISRIQSLQIVIAIAQIYNKEPKVANDIITKIMRYALSIQTDKFETPRYLRVI